MAIGQVALAIIEIKDNTDVMASVMYDVKHQLKQSNQ